MRNVVATAVATMLLFGASAGAQQKETYDYWQQQRRMVRHGQQAVLMCNGLFTSNRSIEQVFAQELAFLPEPVGTAGGGDYEVDQRRKAVTVGAGHGTPRMRAAFRDGIGCVILAPDQTLDDIDGLPSPCDGAAAGRPVGDRLAGRRQGRVASAAVLR